MNLYGFFSNLQSFVVLLSLGMLNARSFLAKWMFVMIGLEAHSVERFDMCGYLRFMVSYSEFL